MADAMVERRSRGIQWGAAILAGIIAGAIFMVLEMLMVPLFLEGNAWAPPRMIAAILLGEGVLPPPATFEFGMFLAAMIVHFALSIIYTLILAAFVHRMSLGAAILTGALFGLALYIINFYLMTAFFEWFAMARNWVSVVAHISFGIAAAWAYHALAARERQAPVT